jgi:DNA polymerase III delta prime subunit
MTRHEAHTAGQALVARTRLLLAAQSKRDAAERAALETTLDRGAWGRLVTLFGLDPGEAALLSVATALALDPGLRPLVAAVAPDGDPLPTEALVRHLFGLPDAPVVRANARLRFWQLVREVPGSPGTPSGFLADPVVVDWMTGHLAIDADLAYLVRHHRAEVSLAGWPTEETARHLRAALDMGQPAVVLIEGLPGTGRADFAASLAARLGYGAVLHDRLDGSIGTRMRLERFALFAQAALIGPLPEIWPDGLPPAPLHLVPCDGPQEPAGPRNAITLRVRLPKPTVQEQQSVWQAAGGTRGAWADPLAFARLRDIRDLARMGHDTPGETTKAFAALCRARMGDVGQPVTPVYDWDDLVVPETLATGLRSFAREARHRAHALERPETRRIFRAAAGLSAMFAGPPGVGKSMAAQVIAGDLGVPLLRVDLGAVSSKYVGETAKNLTEAFREARNAAAVLFFDEADALFAKRTEATDATGRYANADTGHLLQLLEGHDGVVILSTNRRGAIDPAFIRRLRHVFEFRRAEAAEREDIWLRLLAAIEADVEGLRGRIAALAQTADISPSQIKSAILTARYAALDADGAIDGAMLEAAVALEYAKEGRTSERTTLRRAGR